MMAKQVTGRYIFRSIFNLMRVCLALFFLLTVHTTRCLNCILYNNCLTLTNLFALPKQNLFSAVGIN